MGLAGQNYRGRFGQIRAAVEQELGIVTYGRFCDPAVRMRVR
jgi:hypothetical protein